MLSAHAMVNHLYQTMDASSDTEKELEEGMHEFCKAQDALLKAVERRLQRYCFDRASGGAKNSTFHHFSGKVIQ